MYNDIVCITFAGTDIHRKLQREFSELYGQWFYEPILEYNLEGIKLQYRKYYEDNIELFNYKKYSGYFIWKPLIISVTMDLYPEKIILYADSNLRFKNFPKLYEYIKGRETFFIGHGSYINKDWTKRDTFVSMQCDDEMYWNAHQVWTSLMAFKSTPNTRDLMEDYMYYCSKPECVTDEPNILGKENLGGFVAHRWEQSVMSILVKSYGLSYEWDYNIIPHLVDKIYPEELMEQKKHGF